MTYDVNISFFLIILLELCFSLVGLAYDQNASGDAWAMAMGKFRKSQSIVLDYITMFAFGGAPFTCSRDDCVYLGWF